MTHDRAEKRATRRDVLASTARLAAGIALVSVAATKTSRATPATMEAAIGEGRRRGAGAQRARS